MAKRKDLENDLLENLIEKQIPDGFIKLTDKPVNGLTPEQKVILNRKANIMFNNGNVEDARRIFITTGYSDGLTRVGNYYMEKNQSLKALKAYFLAHNKRESEAIYEKIAQVLSSIIRESN